MGTRKQLEHHWSETLRRPDQKQEHYERLADEVAEFYNSGDSQFRVHIANRSAAIEKATGIKIDLENFDSTMAKALIADEVGFDDWDSLIRYVDSADDQQPPILFKYAVAAMERGDFSALGSMLGGHETFDDIVARWLEQGLFEGHTETLSEIFSAACMLGQLKTVAFLLDRGVDPYAGMKTGLAGPHYAASSGKVDVIKLLIERHVPLEVKNMYGGTVFEQAIWSAVNEYRPQHAEIVEKLVRAGAVVDEGYQQWWEEQSVPDASTKQRIAKVLDEYVNFHRRVGQAEEEVRQAENDGASRALADALKNLGDILRRPPFSRDAANAVYTRAADLYAEIGLPLESAWVKRHIGINHEYAGRLEEAEKFYDEALTIYRTHGDDDLDHANAVRYPAVIKDRLGKRSDSAILWEEAYDRYRSIHPNGVVEGVAEAAAWLTIYALDSGDIELAKKWFARAGEASDASSDPDTHKFIEMVRQRMENER